LVLQFPSSAPVGGSVDRCPVAAPCSALSVYRYPGVASVAAIGRAPRAPWSVILSLSLSFMFLSLSLPSREVSSHLSNYCFPPTRCSGVVWCGTGGMGMRRVALHACMVWGGPDPRGDIARAWSGSMGCTRCSRWAALWSGSVRCRRRFGVSVNRFPGGGERRCLWPRVWLPVGLRVSGVGAVSAFP
jgi:hypothetical protein